MVERVARAIYEARNGPGCSPWARQAKSHKDPYLTDARAAIEAMREPTQEMREGFEADGDFVGYLADLEMFRDCWSRAIDVALQKNTPA